MGYDLLLIESGGVNAFTGDIKRFLLGKYNPNVLRYYPLTKSTPFQFDFENACRWRHSEFMGKEGPDVSLSDFVNDTRLRIIGTPNPVNKLIMFDFVVESGRTVEHCIEACSRIGYQEPFELWTRDFSQLDLSLTHQT